MKISDCKKNGKTVEVKTGSGNDKKIYVNGTDTKYELRGTGIYRNGTLMTESKNVKDFLQKQGVIDS